MALHVVGYFENQDGAGTLQNLAAINDTLSPNIWQRDGNTDFLKPTKGYEKVFGILPLIDATVQPRARLTAASLRTRYGRGALEIPMLGTPPEPGSPPVFMDLRDDPIEFDASELVGLETINNPAAATDQTCFLIVGDAISRATPKKGYWIRSVTAASALTADAWNTRPITLDENLVPGTYDVWCALGISTTMAMGRISFGDTQVWKPPVWPRDARADVMDPSWKIPGVWGKLGTFHTDNLPTMELFADAADNEVQVMDLYVTQASRKV